MFLVENRVCIGYVFILKRYVLNTWYPGNGIKITIPNGKRAMMSLSSTILAGTFLDCGGLTLCIATVSLLSIYCWNFSRKTFLSHRRRWERNSDTGVYKASIRT